MTTPKSGLWLQVRCRHCSPPQRLHQVAAQESDGMRAHWVGRCGNCGTTFAVTASMAVVAGRHVN